MIETRLYSEQILGWPDSGQHILAHYDSDSIVVYQAYRASIASFAVANQKFGGDFSYTRMSWIKPNFLWMMYRSGWAEKEGQERILAIRMRRSFFEEILEKAVPSSFSPDAYESMDTWKAAVSQSDVRLQWDPDHDPHGKAVSRRAIQLGLRGDILKRYGGIEIQTIEDITPFVTEQRASQSSREDSLATPVERPYVPASNAAAKNAGIDLLMTKSIT